MAGLIALAATTVWITPLMAMPHGAMKGRIANHEAPVILAQADDPEVQVQQMQEQIRQLNGKIEDMSYQLLQMQETLRKAQEDNEFRFQQLEKGGKKKTEAAPANQNSDTANASGDQTPGANQDNTDSAALDQPTDNGEVTSNDSGSKTGNPPVDLGDLKIDKDGNLVGADQQNPDSIDTTNLPPPDTSTENQTASLGKTNDPDYDTAYQQILSGDYASAESSFSAYIQAHPDAKRAADARFWLGEAQYSQGKFTDAAKTFLDGYKAYGKSPKAPEMLLKLAMSLAKLDSKDTACATLREVPKAYPKASRAIITKVASEQKRLAC
jgi:tol-pal system protein YbgF